MSLPERYARHLHPYGRWGVWAEERRSFETRIALLEIENRKLKSQQQELLAACRAFVKRSYENGEFLMRVPERDAAEALIKECEKS